MKTFPLLSPSLSSAQRQKPFLNFDFEIFSCETIFITILIVENYGSWCESIRRRHWVFEEELEL